MRILIVEDEPRIRAFVARGLTAEGFVVDECSDGGSALGRALHDEYDLVVLDLLLPRLDGLSFLRELQRLRPELSVLILSARTDLATKLKGFELGARDYLAKPFCLDELLARVRVQLRVWPGADGNLIRAGRVSLDLARRQVCVEGTVSALSDREFRLLQQLVEHAGETVSRERLLANVWGYHFDPCSNVVDVCIRRLRKKLGADVAIETVRNVGYRLAAA
jgi:DNA-binding response OmpR family regulator